MTLHTTRRGFIKATTAGATGALILSQAKSAKSYSANEKLNIALIGVGGRGRGFIRKVDQIGQNLVAVCDCDEARIKAAGDLPPGTKTYRDYRELLDQMDKQIDAVIIATPHHTQPGIAAAAMRRGKHVYCEKPIGHDVGEARAMRELANKYKVVTQMGNQGVATDSFRRTLEMAQDGGIGEILEAHQWFVGRPNDAPPPDQARRKPPDDPTKLPEGMDWNLFLGPAPQKPYDWSRAVGWSRWRDYGTGMLGMGGAHSCHMTFNTLNLRALWDGNNGQPCTIRVEAECSEPSGEKFPLWEVVKFHIPSRGAMPPATVHWYKGPQDDLERLGIYQNMQKIAGRSLDWAGNTWAPTSGSLVVGSKGTVHTNMHNSACAILPMDKFPNQDTPPQKIAKAGSHEREWVNAVKSGQQPFSNFDYAGPVIEFLLLGNICTLLNRPIEFDPVACKIIGDEAANAACAAIAPHRASDRADTLNDIL
jgi:hypothetical protein